MTKTKEILLGILFVICVGLTIFFRIQMDNQDISFEEVQVSVVSTDTEKIKVKTGYSTSQMTKYIVTVRYEGKTYDLGNVHSLTGYREGSTVKAYLANGKLYANEEGVTTSTPVSYGYFGCLIASFILFILFASFLPVLFKKKQ